MGVFSHWPLQKSVYQALTGDATLMALVEGVFDHVPQGTAFPYVTIGEAAGQDWSSKTTGGMQYILTLHVFSREGGRKQTAQIMERIHTLLHQVSLSVTGHALVLLRFTGSDILLERDGATYHGVMRFRAITESTS